MKKTDKDHPLNKRMKLDTESEHQVQINKENSFGLSNGVNWNNSNSKKNSQKRESKLISKEESMSFNSASKGLNSLEERSLKLRRCETEVLKRFDPALDQDEDTPLPQSPEDMLKEIMRLRIENRDAKAKLQDKNDKVSENRKNVKTEEDRYNQFNALSKKMEKSIKELSFNLEVCERKKAVIREALIKYITKSEDQLKKEKKIWVKEQLHRLGRFTPQRIGAQFKHVWEDGEEFRKLNIELEELNAERERIDKLKKTLKAKHKQAPAADDHSDDSIVKNDAEYQMKLDLKEEKEILTFKLSLNQKAIQDVQEKLSTLEKEKILFQVELNRISEEERSKLCGKSSTNPYEILNDRYLILSLLGRGGYSEVYKAYDLENCREVAWKIHHFDNNWSESLKASYIKHALRENQTHRELNHPRVVKQYDTVEIDNNSFWTILELCSGPDLFLYLKQHGCLPEKEARLIISQILSGLKYLNEREQVIIHYDLKPQNILFHKGEIKISDFGLWKQLNENEDKIELTSQGVGTYWYQPPECFEVGPHPTMISPKVDVWSVGVIFYELLYGARPFGDKQSQTKILKERIIINDAKEVHFPAKPAVSNETKEFIKKLLSYRVDERLSVEEAYFELISR